jgi:hypothetical protein
MKPGRRDTMKAADNVQADITDDGLVLLDLGSGQIFTANGIAARIWQRAVVDNRPRAEVIESITTDWKGSTPDVVGSDFDEFIDNLKKQRLVVES